MTDKIANTPSNTNSPSAQFQVDFIVYLQRLLIEGDFSATYKFGLLHGESQVITQSNINEIAYLKRKDVKLKVSKEIDKMLEEGKLIQVSVEKNNEFILRLSDQSAREARQQLKVRELGQDVRQSRRHLWSVF